MDPDKAFASGPALPYLFVLHLTLPVWSLEACQVSILPPGHMINKRLYFIFSYDLLLNHGLPI